MKTTNAVRIMGMAAILAALLRKRRIGRCEAAGVLVVVIAGLQVTEHHRPACADRWHDQVFDQSAASTIAA
jgi:hypothetical protein